MHRQRRSALLLFLLTLAVGCARVHDTRGAGNVGPVADRPRTGDVHREMLLDRSSSDQQRGALRPGDGSRERAADQSRDRLADLPRDGQGQDSHKDVKVDPGPCALWDVWACTAGAAADAGSYYCRATCGSFVLVCDSATLDCYCNGNWCGVNVGMGTPCDYCKSSWKKGACCGF